MLGLAGCSSVPKAPPLLAPVAPLASELPAYRVQIGDVMDVKFVVNPELNESIIVRPDGRISTVIVPDLLVYGKTIPEITDALAESYKRELKNPRLAVILRSFAPTRIYVSGEVTNPGEFVTVGPTLTVLQAIARAGGLKASAQSDKIMVLRRGAGEKSDVFAVDAASAATGSRPDADIRLAPFDIVWVPKTGVAEVYTAFQQYIQQFLPLSGTLFYQVHGGGALIR